MREDTFLNIDPMCSSLSKLHEGKNLRAPLVGQMYKCVPALGLFGIHFLVAGVHCAADEPYQRKSSMPL